MSATTADQEAATIAVIGIDNYEENMEAQWALWPYFDESILWHTDWTRWYASNATVREHFRAYRDLGPVDTKNFSSTHTNTYFYEDERGTVADCGAMCGPWELDKEDPNTSSPYGIIHPSRDYMRTILFPDRSLVWIPKDLPTAETPSPAGFELFLGDGEFLRVSIGIVYDVTGKLSQVSALREDVRDFGQFWSGTDDTPTTVPKLKNHTTIEEKQTILDEFWHKGFPENGAYGGLHVSVPGLEQSPLSDPSSLRQGMYTNLPWDDVTVFEISGDGIVVVCPNRLPVTDEDWFELAVAWKKPDGTWAAAVEVVYESGTISHADYITMANNGTSSAPAESANAESGDVESVADDSAAAIHSFSHHWHGKVVVISMVLMAILV